MYAHLDKCPEMRQWTRPRLLLKRIKTYTGEFMFSLGSGFVNIIGPFTLPFTIISLVRILGELPFGVK